jgi:uncharacterized repeat protein (TIGR02543 family)
MSGSATAFSANGTLFAKWTANTTPPNTWHIGTPNAADVIASYNNGTLTISGTGAMQDFNHDESPWFDIKDNITSVVINNGVTTIGNGAFQNLSNLTSATIPNSVTRIGTHAFLVCPSLTTLPNGMGNSVQIIDYGAFDKCSALTSIDIPNSVTTIAQWAFAFMDALSSVTVHWTTPFSFSAGAEFSSINLSKVTLNVPSGTACAYAAAEVWENFNIPAANFTVTFNPQGGSASPTSKSVKCGFAVGDLPVSARTGYIFDGWYTDTNGAGTQYTSSTVCSSNITLFAKWTANTYTITLDKQSGTGGTSTVYEKYNTGWSTSSSGTFNFTNTITLPTRTGYVFGGYYTATNGGGTQIITAAGVMSGSATAFSANGTLYAKWTTVTCKTPPEYDEILTPPTNSWGNRSVSLQPNICYVFRVFVTSGVKYYFNTDPKGAQSFNAKLYLYNNSGTQLVSSDTDGSGERIAYRFNYTGDAYVKVNGNSSYVGNFWFSYRIVSDDADLSSLTVSQGTLSPAFNANTTSYTVDVANDVASITISVTANSNAIGDGTKTLEVGSNLFEIAVTAESGTQKTYTVVVNRELLSPDLQLVSLAVNGDLYQNQTGSFTATLKNNGNAAYNSSLWFYLEKPVTYSPNQWIGGNVYSIAAGETKTITIIGAVTLPPDTYNCNMVFDANNNPSDMATFQFHNTLNVQATVNSATVTGISDELKADVTLYPNPFTGTLHLTGAEGCVLQVIMVNGAVVHTQKVVNPDEIIHLEKLPAGVYLFQIEKDGKSKTIKAVKQ